MPGFVGTIPSGRHGNTHAKARAQAFAALPEWSTCARCHHPMWKHEKAKPDRRGIVKSALHYDHNDTNTGYLGFSHGTVPCPTCGQRCNVKAGQRKGGRIAAAHRSRRRHLPRWTTHTTTAAQPSRHW